MMAAVAFCAGVLPAMAEEKPAKLMARLAEMMPNSQPDSVTKSQIEGFYEVVYGPRLVYMSKDGRYLMSANVIDLETDENITQPRKSVAIKNAVDKVGEGNMVVFGDKKKAGHDITVFTDIDCGYCRKLHSEMAGYNKEGIRIRYLFYPRAGVGSTSYEKAVSVWCAGDKNKAMTVAKTTGEIENKSCDNPVNDHMRLGEMMGINGTPAMVLPDGELLPGYVPPKKLALYLKEKNGKK